MIPCTTTIGFGRYETLTLAQVVLRDPQYFFWAHDRGHFNRCPCLQRMADLIAYRATRIRVLALGGLERAVGYRRRGPSGRLKGIRVCLPTAALYEQTEEWDYWSSAIDLSVAFRFGHYDKIGGRRLVKAVKEFAMGNRDIRLTRARCEAFFNEAANFYL